jgi:hypothetical protein
MIIPHRRVLRRRKRIGKVFANLFSFNPVNSSSEHVLPLYIHKFIHKNATEIRNSTQIARMKNALIRELFSLFFAVSKRLISEKLTIRKIKKASKK